MILYSSFHMNQPIWFIPFHSIMIIPVVISAVLLWGLVALIIAYNDYPRAEKFVAQTFKLIRFIGSRFGL